jgi:hypothetical protein
MKNEKIVAKLPAGWKRIYYPMKTKSFFGFLLVMVALALLAGGCATPTRSYNQDFNEHSPAAPNYAIENMDDTHFKIRVYQGSPLQGPDRIIYMKEAATAISDSEAKRRGWQEWQLNYIQEHDQGWMHVLVGVVIRQK